MDMDEEWMSLSLIDVIMIWSVQCRMAYGGIVRGMDRGRDKGINGYFRTFCFQQLSIAALFGGSQLVSCVIQ